MALIREFRERTRQTAAKHSEATATYSVVIDAVVGRCLQLDTYGSDARKELGKQSQSIRLTPDAIRQLRDVIEKHFAMSK